MLKHNHQGIKSNTPKQGRVFIDSIKFNKDIFLQKPLNEVSAEIQKRKDEDESPVFRFGQ